MGRSGCSSCCTVVEDLPKIPECTLKNNVFMYTLAQRGEFLTEDYIDILAQNQRTHPHESLTRVTQFISKPDYGEYATELNAFSWSGDTGFDVTSHDRGSTPEKPFNFDFLKTIPGKNAGYLVPKKFTIKIGSNGIGGANTGANMHITRELKVKAIDFISSGQNYGISDWQFTEEGIKENHRKGVVSKGSVGALFPEDAIEKGCPNEGTLQNQCDEDIGLYFNEPAMDASRNGDIFQRGFPRDRTNIQIVRTTFMLGYEQTVFVPNLYRDASGPTTIFRGIPIYIEFRAYNFGQELFIRGQSCGFSSFTSRCGDPFSDYYTKWGGPFVCPTEKLVKDEDTITDFLEEYRTLTYCLTYPFLKMEDGTYWFNYGQGRDRLRHGGVKPYPQKAGEPDPRTGGPVSMKALQGTHHWKLDAMKNIKVDCENFFWLNPFAWDRWTTPTIANNDVLGKTLTANDWNTRFLLGGTPATPAPMPDGINPPPPEAGDDEKAYEKYKEELRDLLVETEQKTYIKGPYFQFVDNKLKGNEYDIPQKMYMHVMAKDKLYNVYDQITTGADPASPPNDFNRSVPRQPNHTWKKWHENIIVVHIRSGRSAADWFGRSTVNGATVRVGDEVYYPVGKCDKKMITQVITGQTQRPESVILDGGTPAEFDQIELLKDTITYGMDGRVYRMWMWLESKLNGNTFVSDWYPVPEPDCHLSGTCPTEKYTPLTHKIKKIRYHNHTRPFAVGPEVSSHNDYPYNDTIINFTNETSFKKMVGKDRNFAATAISLDNIGPCSTDPAAWRFDYNEFDRGDNKGSAAVTKNFYYLNDDNKPEARLLNDDDVIVMGKKRTSSFFDAKVQCGEGHEHWDLDSWIYYYPDNIGNGTYLEPEYSVDPECRPNPLKATYRHEFEKSQEGGRIPYIENGKKQDVKFEITQTPNRGYLFTGTSYTIHFEFETIEEWKNRIL
mgnify:CR=1 FL=1